MVILVLKQRWSFQGVQKIGKLKMHFIKRSSREFVGNAWNVAHDWRQVTPKRPSKGSTVFKDVSGCDVENSKLKFPSGCFPIVMRLTFQILSVAACFTLIYSTFKSCERLRRVWVGSTYLVEASGWGKWQILRWLTFYSHGNQCYCR